MFMFKMNSWHFVKGQSPQPGEGLELVVESCGSGSESRSVLGGCGERTAGGEHRAGAPRLCCRSSASHRQPLGAVWLCSRAARLCVTAV